jgi:hypothetical protein
MNLEQTLNDVRRQEVRADLAAQCGDKLDTPRRPKVTLAEVRSDQAAGLSFKAIASKRGCSPHTVYRLLRSAGLTSTRRGRKPKTNGSVPSGQANGKRTVPKVQPEADRAQEPPRCASNGHPASEFEELCAILTAAWDALPLVERLKRLLA